MRSSGGVDAWRERVTSGASAPSHEQIAVRAYELHAKGSPGDAEAHWLAAEQELTSDSNRSDAGYGADSCKPIDLAEPRLISPGPWMPRSQRNT